MKRLLVVAIALAFAIFVFIKLEGDWRAVVRPALRLVVDDGFDDYLSGGTGVAVAVDDHYEVTFPVKPERDVDTITENGITSELVTILASGDELDYLVQYLDIPGFAAFDDAARQDVIKQVAMFDGGWFDGTLLSWTPKPELDSIEITVRHDADSFLKAAIRAEGDRVYLFAVGDNRNPPRTFERFTHSAKARAG